ncbi:hypothetical protein [Coleofasciculus sp.]
MQRLYTVGEFHPSKLVSYQIRLYYPMQEQAIEIAATQTKSAQAD